MKVVSLLSGGIDSTTLLYYLLSKGWEVKALIFNYGQRHSKEVELARRIVERVNVKYEVVDISNIKNLISSGSLTGRKEVPEGHYTDENQKLTIVPNRNMIMLAIAVGHAVKLKYDAVVFGAHSNDRAIYPDCRPAFVNDLDRAIIDATEERVELLAPFINKTKDEIVRLGSELKVPFHMTWSCYKGGEYHCGKCATCVERKEAFKLAGITDPTVYEK